MVLINGVKYACERCIRGHRVTTCTHTDQKLMMIKPKGRPSTACEHCKNARKSKNQHQKCTCSHKRQAGQPHEAGCMCHEDETCTCQKSVHKKKPVNGTLKKQNSLKRQQVVDSSDYTLFQRSNIHNLENNNGDNSNKVHSFDMNLSGGSLSSDASNLAPPSHINSVSSQMNLLLPQDRIGMEYLNDFKATSPGQPAKYAARAGEVTVPLDEYVQPLQQMTNNLNNLLSKDEDENSEQVFNLQQQQQQQQQLDEQEQQQTNQQQQQQQQDFFNDLPVPFSGTGLLDLFDDNALMANLNESTASVNTTASSLKFQSKSPTLSELSPSNTGSRYPPHPHITTSNNNNTSSNSSEFPLFQVVNNSSAASTSSLSPATSDSHQQQQQQQQLPHSSSLHHLHHHYQQLPPHHSAHHTHYQQAHFSPYPAPKRSESFLSISSSTTSEMMPTTTTTTTTTTHPVSSSTATKRPPTGVHINQSTDSLVSLHQQQTLTETSPSQLQQQQQAASNGISFHSGAVEMLPAESITEEAMTSFDNFDLFDTDSIDLFSDKNYIE